MESIRYVFKIVKQGVWMVLKDSFFTVSVHKSRQTILKFEWFKDFYKLIAVCQMDIPKQ